jgi:hypothetical protein
MLVEMKDVFKKNFIPFEDLSREGAGMLAEALSGCSSSSKCWKLQ